MKDSFVIVRVWKSKDRKGNVVSAKNIFKDRIGHVSLQIIEDYKHTFYVSFWPSEPAIHPLQNKIGMMYPVSEDIFNEQGFSDVRIMLWDLDITKIKNKATELLNASNKNYFPTWCLTGKNCCSIVFNIIKESLGNFSTHSQHIHEYIERLAKKYIEPNDLAEFFESFGDLENNFYPKLKNIKADFEKKIKNILLKHADRGSKDGNIVQYSKMYPEIFSINHVEISNRQNKANKRAISSSSMWYKNPKVMIPLATTAIASVAIGSALMSADELAENVSGCLMQ